MTSAVLNSFTKGGQLLRYYGENNKLLSHHRSHISECIVEYYLQNGDGKISTQKFLDLTAKILEKFPSERAVP